MLDHVSIFLWASAFFIGINMVWVIVIMVKKMSKYPLTQERKKRIKALMRYNILYAILLLVIGFLLA